MENPTQRQAGVAGCGLGWIRTHNHRRSPVGGQGCGTGGRTVVDSSGKCRMRTTALNAHPPCAEDTGRAGAQAPGVRVLCRNPYSRSQRTLCPAHTSDPTVRRIFCEALFLAHQRRPQVRAAAVTAGSTALRNRQNGYANGRSSRRWRRLLPSVYSLARSLPLLSVRRATLADAIRRIRNSFCNADFFARAGSGSSCSRRSS